MAAWSEPTDHKLLPDVDPHFGPHAASPVRLVLNPILGSFAQYGTRPQRMTVSSRWPSRVSLTTGLRSVGATLYEGAS
jgi:hypothetical protein